MNIPDVERVKFEKLVIGEADRLGIGVDEYLRKVWYHQQAAVLGEYISMVLVEELIGLLPASGRLVESHEGLAVE